MTADGCPRPRAPEDLLDLDSGRENSCHLLRIAVWFGSGSLSCRELPQARDGLGRRQRPSVARAKFAGRKPSPVACLEVPSS
jgi:hypothetical protein